MHTHAYTRTHARTHACTHVRMHARTHAQHRIHRCMHIIYRIAGFFRGGIFSRIHTATIFRGKIFTNDTVFLITAVEISKF